MAIFNEPLPQEPALLDEAITAHEQAAAPLRADAQARIVWQHVDKRKTSYSIVYLHGFKASQGEGMPVHRQLADSLGCNLYLSRLQGHGLQTHHPLAALTVQQMLQSARQALRIGQQIGEKVIVVGTSTGGSLGLYLAGTAPFSASVVGLVLYSPLVHLYGASALLLESTFMRSALRRVPGKMHMIRDDGPLADHESPVWYPAYALNGALALGELVQHYMRKTLFGQVRCPVFTGYYFNDAARHDRVVSPAAIRRMHRQLGTPANCKQLVNFPQAGSHVICNGELSAAARPVKRATARFLSSQFSI